MEFGSELLPLAAILGLVIGSIIGLWLMGDKTEHQYDGYRFILPAVNDTCMAAQDSNCGMSLSKCLSGKKYECAQDVILERDGG